MATDHEDANLRKNAIVSKADPEQELSRDAEVLVRGSRPGMRDLDNTDRLTVNPPGKSGLQTSEQNKFFVTADSSSLHIQVLHRTFNTFHNFATTFGRGNAAHCTKMVGANQVQLHYTSSVVSV